MPKKAAAPSKPAVVAPVAPTDAIQIRGARQNNLRGFDLDLPLGKLSVVTGPSGSGKSSLAFDTIYAEGQRRYVETFSPYTRQFFERMDKPKVDAIHGIPPAIAIEQVNNIRSTRSTVGTITEINDYLKMLFPRLAEGTCPECHRPVRPETPESIQAELLTKHAGQNALIGFGVPVPKDTKTEDFFPFLQAQGYLRIWVYGELIRTDEATALKGRKLPAIVLVVQDRVTLEKKNTARLSEAVEASLRLGKGQLTVILTAEGQPKTANSEPRTLSFSTDWRCANCDITLPAPTPGLFSFNNPIGACSACKGFGRTLGIDLRKAMPDESLSIREGLVKAFSGSTYQESQDDLERTAKRKGINLDTAFADLPADEQKWIIEGEDKDPERAWSNGLWYGVRGFFKWLEARAYKMHVRVFLSRYRAYTTCSECDGGRLKKEAYHFRIGDKTIADLWNLPVTDLLPLTQNWPVLKGDNATRMLRDEIGSRLSYLDRAGLGYIHLDRQTRTLSGGELQRVNLTTCLGASLVNTLFVLDEPSIGLHPRDIGRLIGVMEGLRDKGNTLLVVEHEESVMRAADNLIEIGPGRGDKGGQLVYSGGLDGLMMKKGSLTGDYLSGIKSIPVPENRRPVLSSQFTASSSPASKTSPRKTKTENREPRTTNSLSIRGARQNNLKNIDVDIPLGVFCCITGVSGSGKSTLIHEVLYRNLLRLRGEVSEDEPGRVKSITGHEQLSQVVMVDQSPLARTPRSTPAVYVGAFDTIRQLFADGEDAKALGITSGFFSFNSGEGRCERCWGTGYEKIEMQFLSDLFVTCPECEGKRYQPHALKVLLHGKSIHDVLCMTIEESVDYFRQPEFAKAKKAAQVANQLSILTEAGLGYLKLGQPLNTLSGGEAQRLKLVGHLIESASQRVPDSKTSLLLLDEPTTGLHFDDIALLVKLLQRLVNEGNSLIVIEHNLDVIQCADWVIDLGPDGGAAGGQLVVTGTPETVAECKASWTGKYLAEKFSVHGSQFTVAEKLSAPRKSPTENSEPRTANAISIRGAREHNLKNINIDIPRDQFVVVTGLSGSGKSTLAFDLVFAEGQRRFLDSMSVYARTFVEQMEKPEVDLITGVPPTVAIEQRISRGGGKSTVATVTEVWHFLRLLFAKLGTQYCPKCDVPVVKQSATAITQTISDHVKRGGLHLLAPLIKARKGFHTEVAENARKHGIETLLVDGELKDTLTFKPLARFKEHTIDAVIAQVQKGLSPLELRPLVDKALKMGKGTIKLRFADKSTQVLSTEMSCPTCDLSFEELDPRLFSFNSPHGWCSHCRGFGFVVSAHGATPNRDDISQLAAELEEERRLTRHEDDDEGDNVRLPCPHCHGSRLNQTAMFVKLKVEGDTSLPNKGSKKSSKAASKMLAPPYLRIQDLNGLAAEEAEVEMARLHFSGTEGEIARDILVEIKQRLHFMKEVGLGYLQLNRSADTLSGGEAQRIRLAAQLGSNLRGVLYVLDEPTIGLHPRDNVRLLNTLTALRDKGNSLLVVEHDDETMRRADTIIDLGPGAGRFGGEIISQGSLDHILSDPHSVTGKELRAPLKHPLRGERRPLPSAKKKEGWLTIEGARANNLRDLKISIPIGRLTVITGVSGSGKSTFMHSVLCPAAKIATNKTSAARKEAKPWKSAVGFDQLSAVHEVDQSPIGKTSRSCPATYVGVLDDIRKLFAQLPASRARGYDGGRFSFNTEGGRCESCQGNGEIKVEMNFLPTTRVPCESCHGLRFNSATLEIEYNGKNIGQILRMSITEAAEFFASQPRIARPLQLLADTGVGYLQLGQPSPTLSGGEAQRMKLVTELSVGQGKTITQKLRGLKTEKRNLYLIEEPTIGLHMSDVARLLDVLHRLVEEGHTVVVIEHHPDVFAEADYLLDIGPEAGAEGGQLVASGTPEEVAKHKTSCTAPFLRQVLGIK
ncbi:excinuclease ABC subunit UvrA [Brevifollis gellanilyticus]|uniref:UvrABC system protein A n=1 Tax=Brevifollis gellanilyticus TaxID=748831 RepID=A0A512MEI8_9BACT|nr:excinuclease ABC subunit UvrA [Brevifollis gellanilyticus]GEP44801.1 UvrABC system protein A [Brevifollis gellanilyticus]